MNAASGVVEQVVLERVGVSSLTLPWLVSESLSVFNYFHVSWRMFCRAKECETNLIAVLADRAISLVFEDNKIVQLASQCIQVVTRIDICVRGYFSFIKAYQKFESAVLNEYPIPTEEIWGEDPDCPSFLYECKRGWEQTLLYIENVANKAFKLLKRFFTLSLLMADASEACIWDETSGRKAVREVASNTIKLMKGIPDFTGDLLEKLDAHQEAIQHLFYFCHINLTVEELISSLSNFQTTVEAANTFVNFVEKRVTDSLIYVLKKFVVCGVAALGVKEEDLPAWLSPDPETEHVFSLKTYGRFAPKEAITRVAVSEKKIKEPEPIKPTITTRPTRRKKFRRGNPSNLF